MKITKYKKDIENCKSNKDGLFQKVLKLEKELHKTSNLINNEKDSINNYKIQIKKENQAKKINMLLEITDLEKIISQKKKIFKNLSK